MKSENNPIIAHTDEKSSPRGFDLKIKTAYLPAIAASMNPKIIKNKMKPKRIKPINL
jgi:hypothetical protein